MAKILYKDKTCDDVTNINEIEDYEDVIGVVYTYDKYVQTNNVFDGTNNVFDGTNNVFDGTNSVFDGIEKLINL
jgi:hypothetical protein